LEKLKMNKLLATYVLVIVFTHTVILNISNNHKQEESIKTNIFTTIIRGIIDTVEFSSKRHEL